MMHLKQLQMPSLLHSLCKIEYSKPNPWVCKYKPEAVQQTVDTALCQVACHMCPNESNQILAYLIHQTKSGDPRPRGTQEGL